MATTHLGAEKEDDIIKTSTSASRKTRASAMRSGRRKIGGQEF